jgi:dihydroorotase
MRHALEQAGTIGLPVISHSEDLALAAGGSMNEGSVALRLGYKGIPNAAESIMVMRDIALSELTGARLHIAHVSTRESVDAIRQAKRRGVPVTAETAPHYFALTDEAVAEYGTNAKMNPPLRSEKDRQAILEGLIDGTIDAIATDHAPHTPVEKSQPIEKAPNGVIGLETSLPVSLRLVKQGILPLPDLIRKMSTNPAAILGRESGIAVGQAADLTIIDIDRPVTIAAERFRSLSRNTPFDHWQLQGQAVLTMVGGRIVYDSLKS